MIKYSKVKKVTNKGKIYLKNRIMRLYKLKYMKAVHKDKLATMFLVALVSINYVLNEHYYIFWRVTSMHVLIERKVFILKPFMFINKITI